MCPMRFILVFFSAILAGYIAWTSVKSSPDDDDSSLENISSDNKQGSSFNFTKMIQNGFWVFVDMASGRYLWRNIKDIKVDGKAKTS